MNPALFYFLTELELVECPICKKSHSFEEAMKLGCLDKLIEEATPPKKEEPKDVREGN